MGAKKTGGQLESGIPSQDKCVLVSTMLKYPCRPGPVLTQSRTQGSDGGGK